ncbi:MULTISPECIES: acetoin utilization protein AcuC [Alteribacter]|uniref:Acetoin utilization protein AcuC n=1 Tax=Alteribacter keqinensis TaxID=2483800 RepID=A0A3M7TZQ7_9BACI|nr:MULTISPECIES: acetoin utilization protein AcuC [Alteribacter]MBM7096413.1 acetoin utilization protein AcuC [Alteribacter salitolerans]RNA70372.1 acetoin utilization protein AcuC [Alteribacter keqinensis]
MKKKSAFVYSPEQLSYRFNEHHPFNQKRLETTNDLLFKLGALRDSDIIPPRMATEEELLLVHTKEYVEAVKKASSEENKTSFSSTYGLGTEDTPAFPHMHEAASWLVGGTLTAVDTIFEGSYEHALNLGGGLHHGFKGKASGFCIYNDSSIAIEYMRKKYDARVLYIDTDAHHGDGVQWAFYDDPNVCTLSLHETGRYLFPGTGNVAERGSGEGYGYSFNVPLEAFTEDDSFLDCYEKAITAVAEYFRPDVIITQNGADSHYYDPLTHLCSTMKIYHQIPKLAHNIAHQFCEGRWIAVGGGGYDIWRVVPRAWSLIWLEMTDQAEDLTKSPIPQSWIDKWKGFSPETLPARWFDDAGMYPEIPRKKEIEKKNARTVQKALEPIFKQHKNVQI